jgi:GST-like protein
MTIALYTWNTPNGRKISVALEEMGLAYQVHPVDITQGRQFDAEFLRISPNNRIPAIVDTEGPEAEPITVFESGAILLYLAGKCGRFLPNDPRRRVACLEWLMWQVGGFGPMPGQVHHFLGVADPQDQRYGLQRYMAETRRLYGVMDRHLAQHEFFADELTVADFAVLGWAWRHERHRVTLSDFPHVQRWYRTLMDRPAVQRGFEIRMTP